MLFTACQLTTMLKHVNCVALNPKNGATPSILTGMCANAIHNTVNRNDVAVPVMLCYDDSGTCCSNFAIKKAECKV